MVSADTRLAPRPPLSYRINNILEYLYIKQAKDILYLNTEYVSRRMLFHGSPDKIDIGWESKIKINKSPL